MKKIIVLLAMLALLVLTGCDGTTDTNTYDLVQPEAEYELDTWGYNSEVYEWTLKTAPHMTCVMFMLDSGNDMGLFCFNKETK